MSNVNHPAHYNQHPSGVECITIVRWFPFNLGCAVKYIWRAGMKNNKAIEDLEKAIFYLQDEIARLKEMQSQEIEQWRTETKMHMSSSTIPLPPINTTKPDDDYVNSIRGHHYDSD